MTDVDAGSAAENVVEDLLDRGKLIDGFTRYVTSFRGLNAITLSGRWGCGKSTFVQHWLASFQETHPQRVVLDFNAWEAEVFEDPLVPFIAELQEQLFDHAIPTTEDKESLKQRLLSIKKISPALLIRGVIAAGQTKLRDILKENGIEGDAINDLLKEAHVLEEEKEEASVLNQYMVYRRIVKKFQMRVEEYLAALQCTPENPAFCVVDELDRCKPSYALNFIESLAHVLTIPNLMFVVVIDREQIASVVRQVYGEGTNPDGYLRKIIADDFDLEANTRSQDNFSKATIRRLLKAHSCGHVFYGGGTVAENFSALCTVFSLPLRDQEHCAAHIARAINYGDLDETGGVFATFLLVLRYRDRSTYQRLLRRQLLFPDLGESIHAWDEGSWYYTKTEGIAVLVQLIIYLYPENMWEALAPDHPQGGRYRVPNAARVIKSLQEFTSMSSGDSLKNVAQKYVRSVEHAHVG